MKRKRVRSTVRLLAPAFAATSFGVAMMPHDASATSYTWSGNGTSWSVAADWTANSGYPSSSSDTAYFSGLPTSHQPVLDSSYSIGTIQFGLDQGWSLTSSSASNLLTIASDLISDSSSGTNTISANLSIAANGLAQSWYQDSGGTLTITGSITAGTYANPANDGTILFGIGTGSAGTVLLNPSSGNSVSLVSNNTTGSSNGAPVYAQFGTLILGSASSPTQSVNYIANTQTGSTPDPGMRYGSNSTIIVGSGTWKTNDIGANNSNTSWGTLNVLGGSLITGGGRYISTLNNGGNGGGNVTVNGGLLRITGSGNTVVNSEYLGVGLEGFTASTNTELAQVNVQSGVLDVAQNASSSTQIGGSAYSDTGGSAEINESGGFVQLGVTAASNSLTGAAATGSNNGLNIGISGITSTGSGSTINYLAYSGQASAYTITGGVLNVAGTVQGVAPATGTNGSADTLGTPSAIIQPASATRNFNFMGGTLTVFNLVATNLGSNSNATATSNQVTASNNIGTLENYGGTLFPGGNVITYSTDSYGNTLSVTQTPTTGETNLTGNYAGNGGNSTLAFNLAGTTPSSKFQDAANNTMYFSLLSVTGSISLNDALQVNLINGLNPVGDSFKIIAVSGGTVTGLFSNLAYVSGSTAGAAGSVFSGETADGAYAFEATYSSTGITLGDFSSVPEPGSAGLLVGCGMTMLMRRRRTIGETARGRIARSER